MTSTFVSLLESSRKWRPQTDTNLNSRCKLIFVPSIRYDILLQNRVMGGSYVSDCYAILIGVSPSIIGPIVWATGQCHANYCAK